MFDHRSFPGRPVDPVLERHLVSAFLESRDEASFRRLYRSHSPLLYRVIQRSLGPLDMAEETLQETWVRAIEGLPGFRWASSLRTWLTGIAIRCCHEARRAAAKAVVPEEVGLAGTEPRALPQRSEALRVALERAVAELPPRRREILVLHDIEGFTHTEISTLLDIDPGTSKSQLSHARRRLRQALADGTRSPNSSEVATDER